MTCHCRQGHFFPLTYKTAESPYRTFGHFLTIFLSESRLLKKRRYFGLPAHCHDMYALAVRLAFSDDAGGDLHACDSRFCLLFVSFQFVDHLFRKMDELDMLYHTTVYFRRSDVLRELNEYYRTLGAYEEELVQPEQLTLLEDSLQQAN